MASLNLDLDYFSNPKTQRLVGRLGGNASVFPIRLWCYVGKYHAKDGKLKGYSGSQIEAVCGWGSTPGEEPGALIEALLSERFLHRISGGFVVHDWKEHAGHIHAFKERARTGAIAKWEKARSGPHASSIAASNAMALHSKAGQGNAPARGGGREKKAILEFRRLTGGGKENGQ